MASRKRRRKRDSIITSHLGGIKRALLEGDKRTVFLEFMNQLRYARRGIYALYDKKGRLYYAGKASDLPKRLNQHLKDRHSESWDKMTLFLVSESANVSELEGLVVATAKPMGNKQKPRIGKDLRRSLRAYLKEDAVIQIDGAVYPEREYKRDTLSRRITSNKLRSVSQAQLARVLGISQPRVSGLARAGLLRRYIREAGKRDAVLLLLERRGKT